MLFIYLFILLLFSSLLLALLLLLILINLWSIGQELSVFYHYLISQKQYTPESYKIIPLLYIRESLAPSFLNPEGNSWNIFKAF